MIYLLFTRQRRFFSRWIQRFTWSRWSHLAIVYEDEAISAMGFKGVVKVPLESYAKGYSETLLQRIDCENPEAIWAAANEQLGKGFDYLSLLGIFFRRDWQKESRWNCTELCAWACQKGGTPLVRAEHFNRLVPQHLLMSVRLRDG